MKTEALNWSSLGSLVATAAFVHPRDTIVVNETDANGVPNELYDAAHLYLGDRCLSSAPALHLHKPHGGAADPVASLPDNHTAHDTFLGVRVQWTARRRRRHANSSNAAAYSPSGFNVVGRRLLGGLSYPVIAGSRCAQQQHHHQHQWCRCLVLRFPRRHRDVVREAYIRHVLDVAARLRLKMRERRRYFPCTSLNGELDPHERLWSSQPLAHPSTFDTLAVDPAVREGIREDLLRFVARREHYARAGRAWKRGYLIHGPPGTGKTSLVAAMANLLQLDVYELDLTVLRSPTSTTVRSNADLRMLIACTRPKSLIVVEDNIDGSLGLNENDRTRTDIDDAPRHHLPMSRYPPIRGPPMYAEEISLCDVLNFVDDGLWSSCVGERLVVVTTTTNRVDPALLRPGRIDRKIELGYCKGPALRVLAKNYLGECDGDHHELTSGDHRYEELIGEAERLLEEVRMTPADVAEVFMGCDGDGALNGLQKLVDDLNSKRTVQQRV